MKNEMVSGQVKRAGLDFKETDWSSQGPKGAEFYKRESSTSKEMDSGKSENARKTQSHETNRTPIAKCSRQESEGGD